MHNIVGKKNIKIQIWYKICQSVFPLHKQKHFKYTIHVLAIVYGMCKIIIAIHTGIFNISVPTAYTLSTDDVDIDLRYRF